MKAKFTTLQAVVISILANSIMPFLHGVVDFANCLIALGALLILWRTEERG